MNKIKILWIIVLTVLIVFSFVSCDIFGSEKDDNNSKKDGNEIVTFSIDKINSKSFTITLNGANWSTLPFDYSFCHYAYTSSCQVFYYFNGSLQTLNINGSGVSTPFETVLTNSKVRTFTLMSDYTNITGTVSIDDDGVRTYGASMTDGGPYIYATNTGTIYKANPNKSSITF